MRWLTGAIAAAGILAACSNDASTDEDAPACSGVSEVGLATEQTPAGQCPTSPKMLTGTGIAGSSCSQSTDCAPWCCTCSGTGGGSDVAQCSGGTCLDQLTTCCLYLQQCGQ